MILSWKHKGLRKFFESGNKSGIVAAHEKKIKLILQYLDAVFEADEMNLPGMDFHILKGNLKGHFSVSVNGNWRIIFKFQGQNALEVDYVDYH